MRVHICILVLLAHASLRDRVAMVAASSSSDARRRSLAANDADFIATASTTELRKLIISCGLSVADCFEKADLRARAAQALDKKREGTCLAQEWSPSPAAGQKGRQDSRASPHVRRRGGRERRTSTAQPAQTLRSIRMELLPQTGKEISRAGAQQLRKMIAFSGAQYSDCVEKAELLKRAKDILRKPKPLPKPGPIRHGGHVAHVLTPKGLTAQVPVPVLFVFHGAGRTEQGIQHMVLQFSKVASRNKVLVVVPMSLEATWDLMPTLKHGTVSADTAFITHVIDRIRRDYYVDHGRIATMGFSDGGSYAITLAVNNPEIFQAAMPWSAGYYRYDPGLVPQVLPKPRIFHGHGRVDDHFDFHKVAIPMRRTLRESGHNVASHTIKEAGHGTPHEFPQDAVKWWLGLTPRGGQTSEW